MQARLTCVGLAVSSGVSFREQCGTYPTVLDHKMTLDIGQPFKILDNFDCIDQVSVSAMSICHSGCAIAARSMSNTTW